MYQVSLWYYLRSVFVFIKISNNAANLFNFNNAFFDKKQFYQNACIIAEKLNLMALFSVLVTSSSKNVLVQKLQQKKKCDTPVQKPEFYSILARFWIGEKS